MKQSNDLHAFLRKHGAVRKFKKAIAKEGDFTFEELVGDGKTDPNIIASSLFWNKTDEGPFYWYNLNNKYFKQFRHELTRKKQQTVNNDPH